MSKEQERTQRLKDAVLSTLVLWLVSGFLAFMAAVIVAHFQGYNVFTFVNPEYPNYVWWTLYYLQGAFAVVALAISLFGAYVLFWLFRDLLMVTVRAWIDVIRGDS